MNKKLKKQAGFTLTELLVVIAIIGVLSAILFVSTSEPRESAKRVQALSIQRQLQKAVELYFDDMEFYPPDVNRGWDPGLRQPLPYNEDLGKDCAVNPEDCPDCPNCPSNWKSIVESKWNGPYMSVWPHNAPWGGEYDYNNWAEEIERYGCDVPAGLYIGTQRNYDDTNPIPTKSEQWFLDRNLDGDECLNGEVQLLLIKF